MRKEPLLMVSLIRFELSFYINKRIIHTLHNYYIQIISVFHINNKSLVTNRDRIYLNIPMRVNLDPNVTIIQTMYPC